MAIRTPTIYYADVLSIVSRHMGRMIEDSNAAYLCNVATNKIWTQYDWRESLATLPPFYLIPGEQDHGTPAASVPSDFMGLRKAFLVHLTGSIPTYTPITPVRDLEVTHVRDLPHAIGYVPAVSAFRVFPRVPSGISAPNYAISGEYKKRPVKVSANSLASTLLPFDDIYVQVMVEAVKWAALNSAGDPRAGEVGMQRGVPVFSGQLAKMLAAIEEMAQNEGLEGGDPIVKPAEPLVTPSMGWWGGGVWR